VRLQRNGHTDLGQLKADGGQNVFDGHAGGWRGEHARRYNSVRRRQPKSTELTDCGSHRRSSTAWTTVNNQWTTVSRAVHERRPQMLNAPVAVREVCVRRRRHILWSSCCANSSVTTQSQENSEGRMMSAYLLPGAVKWRESDPLVVEYDPPRPHSRLSKQPVY